MHCNLADVPQGAKQPFASTSFHSSLVFGARVMHQPVQRHVWAGLAAAPGGVCRAGRRRVQGVSRQQLRAERQTREQLVLLSEALLQVVHHVLVSGGWLARDDVTKGASLTSGLAGQC